MEDLFTDQDGIMWNREEAQFLDRPGNMEIINRAREFSDRIELMAELLRNAGFVERRIYSTNN